MDARSELHQYYDIDIGSVKRCYICDTIAVKNSLTSKMDMSCDPNKY